MPIFDLWKWTDPNTKLQLPEKLEAAVGVNCYQVGGRGQGRPLPQHPGDEGAWLPAHLAAHHAPAVVGEGEAGRQGAKELGPIGVGTQHSTYSHMIWIFIWSTMT